MEDKIEKLKKETDEAEAQMKENKESLEDSKLRVDTAKELLKQLDPEEQQRIKVSETKLPELITLHTKAKEDYETSLQRFETNKRCLKIYEAKLGASQSNQAEVEENGENI
jgi:hypothetical protein